MKKQLLIGLMVLLPQIMAAAAEPAASAQSQQPAVSEQGRTKNSDQQKKASYTSR